MADNLTWTISSPSADTTRVRLKGDITERAGLDELVITDSRVVLELDCIRYINSSGIKSLSGFLRDLSDRCAIEAVRCSPTFVNQLNMMPALAKCMHIRSVMAPMECSECVAETHVLVEVGSDIPTVPERTCEICGAPMLLADLPGRYFNFAGTAEPVE